MRVYKFTVAKTFFVHTPGRTGPDRAGEGERNPVGRYGRSVSAVQLLS